MLDVITATNVRNQINNKVKFDISMEDVMAMKPISVSTSGGYMVLGLQKGDLTILCWVRITDSGSVTVETKTMGW